MILLRRNVIDYLVFYLLHFLLLNIGKDGVSYCSIYNGWLYHSLLNFLYGVGKQAIFLS